MAYGPETEIQIARVVAASEAYGSSSIIALAGVPGTGKSFIAYIAGQRHAGDPLRVREIQFHPSYTYEEFVEGMRLDATGAVEALPGIFTEWNERALADPSRRYVLLIEEFTRANVSAVLGELMTYVEHRERPFLTMYSRRPLTIAKNLTVITTYNPLDKSAIDLDAAIQRRLRILDFNPSTMQLEEMLAGRLAPTVLARLKGIFDQCQKDHADDYRDLMPFGHGVFAEVRSEADLHDLWNQRLSKFVRRPVYGPHPFAETIESAYPWREKAYQEKTQQSSRSTPGVATEPVVAPEPGTAAAG